MALTASLSAVTASDATFSAAGATAWLTITGRTATLAGIASAAQGGTNSAFFQVAGPTVARTYTFPDQDATILYAGGSVTATTNANLTGPVTSVGNATAIANGAIALAKLADGTAGNVVTYSAAGAIAVVATGTATHVLTSNGAGAAPTFQAAAGGGTTLNGVTAATGAVTIASANNTGIVWNWANTTDSTIAFTYGETSAATNGTLNNQVLFRVATTTSSTAVPLNVEQDTPTATIPGLLLGAHAASATLPPVQAFRFSRGTLASPTVITTGDDLGRISGFGYVGATNTYQEACRITLDSTGAISDSATGIGGVLRFAVATVGGEPIEVFNATSAQLLSVAGSASKPAYSFASAGDMGPFVVSGNYAVSVGGVRRMSVHNNTTDNIGVMISPDGTLPATIPSALYVLGSSGEGSSLTSTVITAQYSGGDANGAIELFRKSRGSPTTPTVITTGDTVGQVSAAAYLGATNLFRETARIEIKSKGTISDATTGVGSIVTIYGKTQGTDATVQPTLVITDGSTASIKFAGTGMFTANGSTIATIGATCPGSATVVKWFTFTDSTGTVCYVPCF